MICFYKKRIMLYLMLLMHKTEFAQSLMEGVESQPVIKTWQSTMIALKTNKAAQWDLDLLSHYSSIN